MIFLLSALALQPEPGSSTDLYERAVVERRQGNLAAAAADLEELVQREPQNSDGWVLLGFARRDMGDREGARIAFERALASAPEYQDAKDGLVSLARSTSRAPGWRTPSISVDAARTAVKGGKNWTELRVAGAIPVSQEMSLHLSLEESRRFGLSDTFFEGRLDARVHDNAISYYAGVGAAPHASFRPVWQVKAGATYKLSNVANPLNLSVDSAAAKYLSGQVITISPGVQQYFAGKGAWVTGQWINIFADGRHLSGGLVRVDLMATGSARLFGGLARAPDLSEGRAIQNTSLFGGTALAIGDGVSWRSSVARDTPSTGQRRLTFSTGLDLKFR